MAHIKKINLYTTGENPVFVKRFETLTECANHFGVSLSTISQALSGERFSKKLNGFRIECFNTKKPSPDSKPQGTPVFIEKVNHADATKIKLIKEIVSRYTGNRISKSDMEDTLWEANELQLAKFLDKIKKRNGFDVLTMMLVFFDKKDL